jgi:hypothetical protein
VFRSREKQTLPNVFSYNKSKNFEKDMSWIIIGVAESSNASRVSVCTDTMDVSKTERDSSVIQRWATGWMIGGSSPGKDCEFFSSSPRPDRLWGLKSHLAYGYQGLFPSG